MHYTRLSVVEHVFNYRYLPNNAITQITFSRGSEIYGRCNLISPKKTVDISSLYTWARLLFSSIFGYFIFNFIFVLSCFCLSIHSGLLTIHYTRLFVVVLDFNSRYLGNNKVTQLIGNVFSGLRNLLTL